MEVVGVDPSLTGLSMEFSHFVQKTSKAKTIGKNMVAFFINPERKRILRQF